MSSKKTLYLIQTTEGMKNGLLKTLSINLDNNKLYTT